MTEASTYTGSYGFPARAGVNFIACKYIRTMLTAVKRAKDALLRDIKASKRRKYSPFTVQHLYGFDKTLYHLFHSTCPTHRSADFFPALLVN